MKQPPNAKNNLIISMLILLMLLVLPDIVLAEAQYQNIGTKQLRALLDQKHPFVLIDARSSQEYQESHITSAINIPYNRFMDKTDLLPADKTALLVIYCNEVRCDRSHKLALQIDLLGYTNIQIYSEGIAVWQERRLPLDIATGTGQEIVINNKAP